MLEFPMKSKITPASCKICLCSDDGKAERNHGYIDDRKGSSAGRGGDRGGGGRSCCSDFESFSFFKSPGWSGFVENSKLDQT